MMNINTLLIIDELISKDAIASKGFVPKVRNMSLNNLQSY